MRRHEYATVGVALLFVLLLPPAPVAAQASQRAFRSGSHTAIGYAGAFPHGELGAGFLHFPGMRGLGVFGEVKMSLEDVADRYNYCPEALGRCEAAWVQSERNDVLLQSPEEWLIFNAGAVLAITDDLAVMLGGGAARQQVYREYLDPEVDEALRITPDGTFYVPDTGADGWRASLVTGALLRAGSLVFRFGYETGPRAASVGVLLFFR